VPAGSGLSRASGEEETVGGAAAPASAISGDACDDSVAGAAGTGAAAALGGAVGAVTV